MKIRSLSTNNTTATSTKTKNSNTIKSTSKKAGFKPSSSSLKAYDTMRSIVGESALVLPKMSNIMLSIEGNSR